MENETIDPAEPVDGGGIFCWLSEQVGSFIARLPKKYNGKFNYSRDSESPSPKNIHHLRDEAKIFYKAIRDIEVDFEETKKAA